MAIEGTHGLWADLAVEKPGQNKKTVHVLGVPYDGLASARKGAAEAPSEIRMWSRHITPFTEDRTDLRGLQLLDHGDMVIDDAQVGYAEVERVVAKLTDPVVVLGGDHSISIPVLREMVQNTPEMGLLWIDAHPDLCDSFDGSRLSHACVLRRALDAGLDPNRVVMVGVRSWEEQELEIISKGEMLVITAAQIAENGMAFYKTAIRDRLAFSSSIYISCDIDSLDPSVAPGTGIPDHGGLSMRDVLATIGCVAGREILGLDIVEVAPPLDPSGVTVFAALKIIMEFLGIIARQKG